MMDRNSGINDSGAGSDPRGGYYRRPAGRTRKPGLAEVLKYFVLAAMIAYISFLMVFTSGSTKPFEEIEKAVEASVDMKNMKKADVQGLKRYYGLNSADYDGVMLYISESSISTEEISLIKIKDDGQMQQVKEAAEERIESRKNDFEGYAPEQAQLLSQAQVSVRGKYLFVAVAPKAESYKDAFMRSL